MARRRLGVALLVPPPLAHEIDGLRRGLGDGSLGRTPAHLTLLAAVNVRDARMEEALGVLRAAGAATRPFTLRLGPPASFWPETPVLYLRVGGDDGVAAVRALRERVFVEPLARRVSRPFVPHVTLADEAGPERLEAAERALGDYRATWTVTGIHLLEEHKEGEARVWRPVAHVPFAARAVVGRGGLELDLTTAELLDPEATAFSAREWAAHGALEQGEAPHEVPLTVTARREGDVVGVAEGHTRGTEAYLANLVVAAAARGEGIGSHVLAAFESAAAERGAAVVSLRCPTGGDAEAFYRRHGYVDHVRLPAWRHGRDFVQLRRHLA